MSTKPASPEDLTEVRRLTAAVIGRVSPKRCAIWIVTRGMSLLREPARLRLWRATIWKSCRASSQTTEKRLINHGRRLEVHPEYRLRSTSIKNSGAAANIHKLDFNADHAVTIVLPIDNQHKRVDGQFSGGWRSYLPLLPSAYRSRACSY